MTRNVRASSFETWRRGQRTSGLGTRDIGPQADIGLGTRDIGSQADIGPQDAGHCGLTLDLDLFAGWVILVTCKHSTAQLA